MESIPHLLQYPARRVTQYVNYLRGYVPVATHEPPGGVTGEIRDADGQGLTMHYDLEQSPARPTLLRKWWSKTGLDGPTLIFMIKGALPPVIALALYQIDSFANTYTTQGFLVSVITVLGFAIFPRSRFVQTVLMELIGICFTAALCAIAMLTIVAARVNSSSSKDTDPKNLNYNAPASAVAGLWLFLLVFLLSSLRSAFTPMSQLPTVLGSIFVIISMVYSQTFPSYDAAFAFLQKFLRSFVTAFALSTLVNLFVFPQTSRDVVFDDMTSYIGSLRQVFDSQVKYFKALEGEDGFKRTRHDKMRRDGYNGTKAAESDQTPAERPEAKDLSSAAEAMKSAHAKLVADLKSGKEEVAWGKLRPTDMSHIATLLRRVFLPMLGLTSVLHIFQRAEEHGSWGGSSRAHGNQGEHDRALKEWQETMKQLHASMEEIVNCLDEALEHVLLTLQLISRSNKQRMADEENAANRPIPGTEGFTKYNDRRIKDLFDTWRVTLKHNDYSAEGDTAKIREEDVREMLQGSEDDIAEFMGISRDQAHLYLTLYVEHLLWAATQGISNLVEYADSKVADKTLSSWRLIVPTPSRARKWAQAIVMVGGKKQLLEPHFIAPMEHTRSVYMGKSHYERKDPDHMPGHTKAERIGNKVRAIPRALHSPHALFGFRVAVAALSISLLAFFPRTIKFFIQERLVWGVVMLTVSFTRTAGQSLFNFCHRVFGTFLGAVASMVIYYVVAGHTAGVLILTFFWLAACYYMINKKPQHILSCILAAVTPILVCGYELQTMKIGIPEAEKNGQIYHPTYLLAPYRLAAVAGGLAVGFFWEIFPYPISDHSELRHGIGSAVYLLCNLHEMVSETVRERTIGSSEGNVSTLNQKDWGKSLEKESDKTLAEQVMLLNRLKAGSQFIRWEFVGGTFPVKTCLELIKCTEDIMMNTALLGYASKHFLSHDEAEELLQTDLRELLDRYRTASHRVTGRLCLISSSVASGNALPPFLEKLEPMASLAHLDHGKKDVLNDVQKVVPGHAALAVMQVAHRLIVADVNELTELVKQLVGELSFEFRPKVE